MTARVITFTLPFAYGLPNVTIRQNRWQATRAKNDMMRQVMAASYNLRIPEPFKRAHVTIERHSSGVPDEDNLRGGGGLKRLLDCLTTPVLQTAKGGRYSYKNKRGQGFIVDDSPKHITQEVRAVLCKRGEEKTVVTIREVL